MKCWGEGGARRKHIAFWNSHFMDANTARQHGGGEIPSHFGDKFLESNRE